MPQRHAGFTIAIAAVTRPLRSGGQADATNSDNGHYKATALEAGQPTGGLHLTYSR